MLLKTMRFKIRNTPRVINYRGDIVPLFYHRYNCGTAYDERTTERTVEMALADLWLTRHHDNVIELGAVTPYYFPGRIPVVVDPTDRHPLVTISESLFTVDFKAKNVLCISTIEHIGTSDYGSVSVK
jgi:hypothetical protein